MYSDGYNILTSRVASVSLYFRTKVDLLYKITGKEYGRPPGEVRDA
jgi:hypothetical protein